MALLGAVRRPLITYFSQLLLGCLCPPIFPRPPHVWGWVEVFQPGPDALGNWGAAAPGRQGFGRATGAAFKPIVGLDTPRVGGEGGGRQAGP